jgi:hypothetical protein
MIERLGPRTRGIALGMSGTRMDRTRTLAVGILVYERCCCQRRRLVVVVWEKHGAPSRIKKGFVELEIRLEGSRSGESILCFSARKVEGGLWTSGKAKNWVIGRGIRSEIEKKPLTDSRHISKSYYTYCTAKLAPIMFKGHEVRHEANEHVIV